MDLSSSLMILSFSSSYLLLNPYGVLLICLWYFSIPRFNFLIFIYLFIEMGRERERQGEESVASHMCPNQRPVPQPRHVPRPIAFLFLCTC